MNISDKQVDMTENQLDANEPAPQKLTRILEGYGIAADITRQFLYLIDAPDEVLPGLVPICINFIKATGPLSSKENDAFTDRMRSCAVTIVDNKYHIKEVLGSKCLKSHPYGLMESHPLFALMMHESRNSVLNKTFSSLLVPFINQYHRRMANGIASSTLSDACRAYRSIFDHYAMIPQLEYVHIPAGDLSAIANTFDALSNKALNRTTRNYLITIARHMRHEGQPHKTSTFHKDRKPGGKYKIRGIPMHLIDAQDEDEHPSEEHMWISKPFRTWRYFEIGDEDEPIGPDVAVLAKSGEEEGSRDLIHNTFYYQICLSRRHVTKRWGEMTEDEVRRIDAALPKLQDINLELFLMISLAYYYGWGSESIASIRSFREGEKLLQKIYINEACDSFQVPDVRPRRKNDPVKFMHFELPIPRHLKQPLTDFIAGKDKPDERIFSRTRKLNEKLRLWLEDLEPTPSRSIPTSRFFNHFIHIGLATGIDGVVISNIVGRAIPDSKTQINYTGIVPAKIRADFLAVHRKFHPNLLFSSSSDIAKPDIGVLIGDFKALTIPQARDFLRLCRAAINDARASYCPWEGFFNAVTAYVFLCLQFTTGMRSVVSPLRGYTAFDKAMGILPLNDKHSRKEGSLRYVFIPTPTRTLLQEYVALREHSLMLLAFTDNGKFQSWKNHQDIPLIKRCFADTTPEILDGVDAMPYLFTLIDSKLTRLRPSMLRVVADIQQYNLDIGRHFLRSELVNIGCPSELIDAQMGHWSIGREPFGPASSLSIHGFAKSVGPYLEEIAKKLDIRPWKT